MDTIPPAALFNPQYPYASSTSPVFRQHFEQLAGILQQEVGLTEDSFVCDIGSNDGCLLRPLKELGIRAIGIEPSANVAALAQQEGLETRLAFFGEGTVQDLGKETADVVTACNVYAHVPDLRAFTQSVYHLLKPHGVFVIEVEYLGDILEQVAYGNFYSDHVAYWSLGSLSSWLANRGFRVYDAERIDTHGGSLRVWADKQVRPRRESVSKLLAWERDRGHWQPAFYLDWANRVFEEKQKLQALLAGIKMEGKRIAAYGAAAKGLTLLMYNQIGPETLDFIIDDSPLKQGKLVPGVNIPIVGIGDGLPVPKPDYLLVLAWNFSDSIIAKTRQLGVQYILPVPPKVID